MRRLIDFRYCITQTTEALAGYGQVRVGLNTQWEVRGCQRYRKGLFLALPSAGKIVREV